MEIKVLGQLTAAESGTSVVPSAAKPRQILALLALNANHVVTVQVLMEELWGLDLPRSAPTTLQTYILQLRRKLGAALAAGACAGAHVPVCSAKDLLATRHNGYLLAVDPRDIDAREFDRLTAEGYAAYEQDDPARASRLLSEALALWRGPALVDLQRGPLLEIEAMRLQESRLAALGRRIDAELRLHHHYEILGELAGLTAQYPLDENLHAQFMLALYRCGRASGALQAFRRLRAGLIDELGLEPSARVQRLHQAILASDPALDAIARV
ncbi:AfsR/SARP family transcriptional regulator [Streptomyces sp. NPDC049577]|uniref:AfsR/SARP family transcriptional regulator n=1 Tax=Streptomyces sp. NPDC049577 TaxID=3155153 RepID=UPI00341EF416